jgi:hypothetical protein
VSETRVQYSDWWTRPDGFRNSVKMLSTDNASEELHPIVDIAPFDSIVNMIGGLSSYEDRSDGPSFLAHASQCGQRIESLAGNRGSG